MTTEVGVTQNIGDADRTIRLMLGAILGVIFFQVPRPTTVFYVIGVVDIILLVSSLTGWSLLYFLLRISTRDDRGEGAGGGGGGGGKPLEQV